MGALTEKLNKVNEVLNLNSIMDSASNAVLSLVDTISDKGIEMDDAMRNSLIERRTEAISGEPSDIKQPLI